MSVFVASAELSLKKLIAYPGSFILYVVVQVVSYLSIPFMYSGLWYRGVSLTGWDEASLLALMSVAQLTNLAYDLFLGSSVERLCSDVAAGKLDHWLVKPIPTMSLAFVSEPGVLALFGLPVPIVLLAMALANGLVFSAANLMLTAIVAMISVALRMSFGLIYLALTFRTTNVYTIGYLISTLFSYTAMPEQIYSGALRVAFVSLIPVGLAATLPMYALKGELTLTSLVPYLVTTGCWLGIGILSYTHAIKRYVSHGG